MYGQTEDNLSDISVIIPVYNALETMRRCIDSVLNQSIKNYEIVLVDDGSTDGSETICDYYGRQPNITVVHKKNGGLGSARNAGIDAAKGKYICFVDSDDYVRSDYLKSMYKEMKKDGVGIAIAGYTLRRGNFAIDYSPQRSSGMYSGREYYRILLQYARGNSILYFAWNKMFDKSVIVEYGLRFLDRHCAEDMLFNAQYFQHIHKISIVKECEYVYIVGNRNSLSSRRRPGFWDDMNIVYREYTQIYKNRAARVEDNNAINELTLVLLRNAVSNYISNEKFIIRDTVRYIKKCCADKIIRENIRDVRATAPFQKVVKLLVNKKRFFSFALLIKAKSIIKNYLFPMFAIMRKFC